MYKLIAADIDGTLLTSEGKLTDEVKQAVVEASKLGIKFILSTGRPYQAITRFLQELNVLDLPHIIYNGAMVVENGKTIFSETLPDEVVPLIAREGHLRGSTMICWAGGKMYTEFKNAKVEKYMTISSLEPIILDDLGLLSNVTKFVWYDTPELTAKYFEEMKNKFGEKVNVHPTRVDFLEFVNKNTSKAAALEAVGKRLGINKEEMISVGDGYNDVSLIKYAGLGVAMGNAPTEVKNCADFVTSSCDENGVKELIDRFILKK